MVKGFEEEAPPPPEGSMHINGGGHRPLTSPFRWGRGTGLCGAGFNVPIVDLCHMPSKMYTVFTVPALRLRPLELWISVRTCLLSHFLSASSCCFSFYSSTLPTCLKLLSHVLSSASTAPLQTLSLFSLLSSCFFFFFCMKAAGKQENIKLLINVPC